MNLNTVSYGNLFNVLKTRSKDNTTEIGVLTVAKAFQINNYFLLNKIYLSGYDLELNQLKPIQALAKYNSFMTNSTYILFNSNLNTPLMENDTARTTQAHIVTAREANKQENKTDNSDPTKSVDKVVKPSRIPVRAKRK